MGIGEGTLKEIAGRTNEKAMNVRSYETGQDKKCMKEYTRGQRQRRKSQRKSRKVC